MLKSEFITTWTRILLFLNVFIAEANFRQRSIADKSLDLQVALKMGLWVFTFLFCIILFRLWGKKLLQVDNIFQVLLLISIVASCFYAPVFTYSIASAFSLVAVVFLLLLSSVVLDTDDIIRQLIFGCTLVSAISIIVYFADPAMGRMHEWNVQGTRLAGITGTANAAGYIAAMALLALYYYRGYLPKLTLTFWIFVAINMTALLMSNSRTAMLAMILSIAAASIVKPSPARLAGICFLICAIILFCSFIDYNALFAMMARSGDPSEITSGTGRTSIWSVAISMIHERPWLGWGYASTNTLLPAASKTVGYTVTHAHNAVLQILLSVGFIGLSFFIMVIGTKFYYAFKSRVQLNIALITFLMIDGLTEPIAFQGPATTTTIALAIVLALNYERNRNNEAVDHTHQQRLPGPGPA